MQDDSLIPVKTSFTMWIFLLGLAGLLADEGKKGTLVVGALFRHYDRDGDGKFEEWSRTDTVYFDRNGDGIPDMVKTGELGWKLEWDSDLDGFFDHAREMSHGIAPILSPIVRIPPRRPPAALKRDLAMNRVKIKAEAPRWKLYAYFKDSSD